MPRSNSADSAARIATHQRPSCRARIGGIRTMKRGGSRPTRDYALRGFPCPGTRLLRLLVRADQAQAPSPRQLPNTVFKRSTVCRHFGVVGWHTVFWLPNRPTSLTA